MKKRAMASFKGSQLVQRGKKLPMFLGEEESLVKNFTSNLCYKKRIRECKSRNEFFSMIASESQHAAPFLFSPQGTPHSLAGPGTLTVQKSGWKL
jgi:hypothetical protein